jgi:hypothetical protein
MPEWRFSYDAGSPTEIAEAAAIFEALQTIRRPTDLLDQRFEGDRVTIYFNRRAITHELSRGDLTNLGNALRPPRIPPPPRPNMDVAQAPPEYTSTLSIEAGPALSFEAMLQVIDQYTMNSLRDLDDVLPLPRGTLAEYLSPPEPQEVEELANESDRFTLIREEVG